MPKNKNYITEEIFENWNNIILPMEEFILTRTPEEACHKKTINPSLHLYRKNIEHTISLYKEDKELKTILRKRLTCIENFVKLTKILANKPSIDEKNQYASFLQIEKNSIEHLTKELIKHNKYIQTNKIRLAKYQMPEEHIQPLIFDILAEAFDHLAALYWNDMDQYPSNPNPQEFYPTCLSVLNAYETRLRCLRAEKERLSNTEMRACCDEKILSTLESIGDTIYQSFKTYNVLFPMSHLLKKTKEVNTIESKDFTLQLHLKQTPVTRKKRLADTTEQNNNDGSFFKFKQAKLSATKQAPKTQRYQHQ